MKTHISNGRQLTLKHFIEVVQDKPDWPQQSINAVSTFKEFSTMGEILKILESHLPTPIIGVYVVPIDNQGRELKPRLLTEDINWAEFAADSGDLHEETSHVPAFLRRRKWFEYSNPRGSYSVTLPQSTTSFRIVVKERENQQLHEVKTKRQAVSKSKAQTADALV